MDNSIPIDNRTHTKKLKVSEKQNEKILLSVNYNSRLLENSSDIIFLLSSTDYCILENNNTAQNIFNLENQSNNKLYFPELFQEPYISSIKKTLKNLKLNSEDIQKVKYFNGTNEVPIHFHFSSIIEDNQQFIICFGKNDKLHHQIEIQNKDLLIKNILNSVPCPMYFENKDLIIIDANDNYAELLGISKSNIIGNRNADLFQNAIGFSIEDIKKNNTRILNEQGEFYYHVILNLDGKEKTLRIKNSSYLNRNGEIAGIIGTITDYSTEIDRDLKIIKEKKKFFKLFNLIDEIYFEISLSGKVLYISPSLEKISHYTVDEAIKYDTLNFYQNPTERLRFLAILKKEGSIKKYKINLKDKNGDHRPAEINALLGYDKDKKEQIISGTIKDQTKLNHLLSTIEESERKHKIILDNTAAHIIYLNPKGEILLINKPGAAFLGSKPEQLVGKNISESQLSKELADKIELNLKKITQTKKPHYSEIEFNANNQFYSIAINIQPVLNSNNKIDGIVLITTNISEQKESQRELIKLRTAIEQSTASIFITDTDGIIEFVNPRYLEVSGYSFNEMISKPAFVFSKENKKNAYFKKLWEHLNAGKVWEGEYKTKIKNGNYIWEKAIISPVYDEQGKLTNFIGVTEDISTTKRSQEYEKQSKQNIEILNETFFSILNYKEKENLFKLIGSQLQKIIPDHFFILSSFNSKNKTFNLEFSHTNKKKLSYVFHKFRAQYSNYKIDINQDTYKQLVSGEWNIINNGFTELTNGKIDSELNGKLIRLWNIDNFVCKGIIQDKKLLGILIILNRKKQEKPHKELLETFINQVSSGIESIYLRRKLIKARDEAEEMNRIKSVFLANMSHELRTPLNGILGFSELLSDQIKEKRFIDMISVIHKSGIRLLETLNTILDFTTIESKDIVLNYKSEDIIETIRKIIRNNSDDADKKNLKIILKTNKDKIITITPNNFTEKILQQLIRNAIKFTLKGNIEIKVELKPILKPSTVNISVKDTGVGIPLNEQENVFEEFRQGSEGMTRKFEGTGLGLTISRKFASMMEGTINLVSKPGKGSTFTLSIPYRQTAPKNQ